MSLPDDLDPRLWIEVEGVEGRCYLFANNHTFRGRMCAYSDSLATDLGVSKGQIREASPEAGYWVDGFLAGNEPSEAEAFGRVSEDNEDSEVRFRRWQELCADFRRSGSWPIWALQANVGLDPMATFVAAARSFVELVDHLDQEGSSRELRMELYQKAAALLPAALELREPQIADEDFDDAEVVPDQLGLGFEQWNLKHEELKRLLGDHNLFWEVFDPRTDEASVAATLSDAIADVWSHLRSGLEHIDAGREPAGAEWSFRWSFWSVWGHHLTDILRLITSDFDDENWSLG